MSRRTAARPRRLTLRTVERATPPALIIDLRQGTEIEAYSAIRAALTASAPVMMYDSLHIHPTFEIRAVGDVLAVDYGPNNVRNGIWADLGAALADALTPRARSA